MREYPIIMLKGRELSSFRKKLLGWFREYQRDLPWRRTKDPYRIWLSEIMLQQTRVAAVIPYYQRFLERFPDVAALAAAPREEVLRLWSGLGYYRRARNLQRAAQEIVARHGRSFPRTHKDVLALSGIGPYTAAAILSIAFEAEHAVLDGNVARVLARLFAIRGDLREARRWQLLQRCADELLDVKSPGDWNQAVMELGAGVCTPRSPQCLLCPVSQSCRARKLGIVESLPAGHKRQATVDVTLAAAVLLDPRGRCLLLRPSRLAPKTAAHDHVPTLLSKMWHFPTFAVQQDASAEVSKFLKRVIAKPKYQPFTLEPLPKVRHSVTYRKITVLPFRVRIPKLPCIAGCKIVSLSELPSPSSVAISNLTRKVACAALAHGESPASDTNPTPGARVLFANNQSPQPAP